MSTDEILRRFMVARYEDKVANGKRAYNGPIHRVILDEGMDYGWSEYTPGEGWTLDIRCIGAGGKIVYSEHITDSIPFIHDLCRFGAEFQP